MMSSGELEQYHWNIKSLFFFGQLPEFKELLRHGEQHAQNEFIVKNLKTIYIPYPSADMENDILS
jgi:hypothetical protein